MAAVLHYYVNNKIITVFDKKEEKPQFAKIFLFSKPNYLANGN